MKTLIIMQARTRSSRLPGKALLPVGTYPSAVLAALRASNHGHEIVVATSTEPSDDALAEILGHHGIRTVRGPEEDVLQRHALAASNLSDESMIVRLTADNVIPDGPLIEELVAAFAGAGVDYLCQESPQSGLPYGLGGEAFSAAVLRKADAAAITQHDREHVSPWIRRNCRTAVHRPRTLEGGDYSHLRCTIDDEEDYQRICRLFEDVEDPVRARWLDLAKKLASLPNEPQFRVPYRLVAGRVHSELTLGTAQLGMSYGITNRSGQPSRQLAIKMVRRAVAHGVTALDTARGYGEAEQAVGDALAGAWRSRVGVVTKLDQLAAVGADAVPAGVRAAVNQSIECSCRALGTPTLSTVLLHRAHHHDSWGGTAWDQLLRLRAEGKISRLGASVYEPREAIELLADPDVQHLQVPVNILDWRWQASGFDRAMTHRPDVIVHARSALLQGLLAGSAELWPRPANYDAPRYVREIRRLAVQFGREGPADLCLAYVRSQPWIHSVIVGCDDLEQVDQNLRLFCLPKLSAEQCAELEASLPRAPEALLNPSQWKLAHEQIPS